MIKSDLDVPGDNNIVAKKLNRFFSRFALELLGKVEFVTVLLNRE
jgi:hypothetical protein